MAENPHSFEYFIPVTEVEKRTKWFHIQQQKKIERVGGILRQAQTLSLRPPTLRLCTSLKFSKIVSDRVDEGERGDCIRRGKVKRWAENYVTSNTEFCPIRKKGKPFCSITVIGQRNSPYFTEQ
jgi:hypothetical protein